MSRAGDPERKDWIKFKTRKAWNDPTHAHFLTYSCHKQYKLLARDRSRQWVIDAMAAARNRFGLHLYAYVIMPEHVHVALLLRGRVDRIEHVVAALKRPVSARAKRHLIDRKNDSWLKRLTVREGRREKFRFWQAGGGYDRNVRHEKSLPEMVDYIHANPVRRGLVEHPLDWRWSSARFWDGCGDAILKMDDWV